MKTLEEFKQSYIKTMGYNSWEEVIEKLTPGLRDKLIEQVTDLHIQYINNLSEKALKKAREIIYKD